MYVPPENGSSWRALTLHLIRVVLIFMCCHLNDVEQLISHNGGANKNGPNEKWTHFFTFTHVSSFENGLNTFFFTAIVHFFFPVQSIGRYVGRQNGDEIEFHCRSVASLFIFTIIISASSIKCIFVQREVLIHLKSGG